MVEAIGQVLVFAVVVAISPIPIIGVILMLSTPLARTNGPAFVAGWVVGLAVAGGIVLAISGGAGATEGGGPADWVNILKLVLGLAVIRIGFKEWRGRPKPGEPVTMPSWMNAIDHFTAGRSAGLGVALSAINPKNLCS